MSRDTKGVIIFVVTVLLSVAAIAVSYEGAVFSSFPFIRVPILLTLFTTLSAEAYIAKGAGSTWGQGLAYGVVFFPWICLLVVPPDPIFWTDSNAHPLILLVIMVIIHSVAYGLLAKVIEDAHEGSAN